MSPSKRKSTNITKLFKPRTATLFARVTSFLMDTVLIMGFTTLLLAKVILPQNYAEELRTFEQFVADHQEQGHSISQLQADVEELDPKVNAMLVEIQGLYLLAFWIYFTGTEVFMRGSSLGKKIFRIRTISLRNLSVPNFFEVLLRSGVKALTIQTLFPFLLINYFLAFFTKQRQAGHDFLARTLVVEENEFLEPVSEEEQKEIEEAEEFER